MNTGEFHLSLDDKGRLLIPSKVRAEIAGAAVVVTRAVDRCLWIFPPTVWTGVAEDLLKAASPFSRRGRLLQRRIIAPAQEVEIDRSGRVNVPNALLESAGMERDVTLLVMEKYMELWDSEGYAAYEEESERELQEAAEELGGLVSF